MQNIGRFENRFKNLCRGGYEWITKEKPDKDIGYANSTEREKRLKRNQKVTIAKSSK